MQSAQEKQFEAPLPVRADELRASLHSLIHATHASKISNINSLHGRGSVLFTEGEPARGIYILRTGRATVSITSSEGRVVMLQMAQAGDVLGLNSVLRGGSYDTTVKTLEPCRTDFVARAELIDLMQQSAAGTRAVLEMLSRELAAVTDHAKLLLLPQTVRGRLAKLLLGWSKESCSNNSSALRLDRVFTHEEIAQMICTSRETVTRLLATFTRQQILRISTDTILILDRLALEKIALG